MNTGPLLSGLLETVNLRGWPFSVVPDEDSSAIWAGRPKEKRQITRMISKMALSSASSIRVIWANFGMGKTHTLLYIKHLCESSSTSLKPVYAVLPKSSKGFLDVYRAVMEGFLSHQLFEQLQRLSRSWQHHLTRHPIFETFPDIVHAITNLDSDDQNASSISRQWITARKGTLMSDLRSIGVSQRIQSPEDAIAALSAVTKLLSWEPEGHSKAIVMIDEFQRIGQLRPKPTHEINASLQSYFNENSKGLELILSFSFGKEENVKFMLSDELLSRINPESISLDLLAPDEARIFVRELISQYHIKSQPNQFHPFSEQAVDRILETMKSGKSITPRRIMHLFNHVLSEWMIDQDPAEDSEISGEYASKVLASLSPDSLDEDSA